MYACFCIFQNFSSLNMSIIFFKLSKLLQLNTVVFNQVLHLVNTGFGGNETLDVIS